MLNLLQDVATSSEALTAHSSFVDSATHMIAL